MYEEYQTNPNPGFDPRQRYEDAGGYLRSLLGSFLNKKKDTEDKALEESRYQTQLGMEKERLAQTAPGAEDAPKWAQYSKWKEITGFKDGSPEANTFLNGLFNKPALQYTLGQEGLESKERIAENRDETSRTNTETTVEGRLQGIDKQQSGATQRNTDTNTSKEVISQTPVRPGGAGAAKTTSPTMTKDAFRLKRISNRAKNIKDMAKKAGDIETATVYETLAQFLTDRVKDVNEKTFSKAQVEALDRLDKAFAVGDVITEQMLEDFTTAWQLPDIDPNSAEGGGTGPQIISDGGKRYLEENGQLYEMVMG